MDFTKFRILMLVRKHDKIVNAILLVLAKYALILYIYFTA